MAQCLCSGFERTGSVRCVNSRRSDIIFAGFRCENGAQWSVDGCQPCLCNNHKLLSLLPDFDFNGVAYYNFISKSVPPRPRLSIFRHFWSSLRICTSFYWLWPLSFDGHNGRGLEYINRVHAIGTPIMAYVLARMDMGRKGYPFPDIRRRLYRNTVMSNWPPSSRQSRSETTLCFPIPTTFGGSVPTLSHFLVSMTCKDGYPTKNSDP
jgi:hypothetical protein